MDVLKRLVGVYLVGLALVVAVYFIINAFLVGSIDVLMVWQIVDILMLVGLALGLAFNYASQAGSGSARCRRSRYSWIYGSQRGLLCHRGRWHSVLAQLVFTAGYRRGQPGRQSYRLGHLGRSGHLATAGAWIHRLPAVAGSVGVLTH